jgi:hypothetical protein
VISISPVAKPNITMAGLDPATQQTSGSEQ